MQQGEEGDISLSNSPPTVSESRSRTVSHEEQDSESGDISVAATEEEEDAATADPGEKSLDPPLAAAAEESSQNDHDNVVNSLEVSEISQEDRNGIVSSKTSKFHKRMESVPLKKYDMEVNSLDLPSTGLQTNPHEPRRDRLSSPMERQNSSYSETEDAGLDFVDIRLDQAETDKNSPYGSGAHFASRSAVEIRQDSIRSDSEAAKKVAAEAAERERESKEYQLNRRDRTISEDTSSESSRGSRRSQRWAEGRYMGRRSRPTSRATSPEPYFPSELHRDVSLTALPSPLKSIHPADEIIQPREGVEGGLTMAVADENGEITMVSSSGGVPHSTEYRSSGQEGDLPTYKEPTHEEVKVAEVVEKGARGGEGKDPEAANEGGKGKKEGVGREKIAAENGAPASGGEKDDTSRDADAPKTNGEETAMPASISTGGLSDAADKEQSKSDRKKKRDSGQQKLSALEQHMSRTRMMTLPPKPKQEDVRHLHDYEEMMKLSKEKDAKKQQEAEEKKRQRDVEMQEDMRTWETQILPSWTRARREAKLRKLWCKGIPSSIRGRLWAMACGNNQMLPRNLFSKASAEAKKRIREQHTFPQADLTALQEEIQQTLPSLKLFQREIGALHEDLSDVLVAFVIVRLDQEASRETQEKGKEKERKTDDKNPRVYLTGTASIAAMLLTNLTPSETLIALVNLIAEKPWLRALYAAPHPLGSQLAESAAGYERVFDTLLADQMPKVYANLQARGVRPSSYVTSWVRALFVPYLSFDLVARLWDCILLDEGDAFIYRTCIAIFSLLSARLYVPDKVELLSILKGNNRATLAVWYRTLSQTRNGLTPSLPLSPDSNQRDGDDKKDLTIPSSSVEAPDDVVPLDDIYGGQYNINESNLFDTLDEQVSWWKDSMLERLLDRELVT